MLDLPCISTEFVDKEIRAMCIKKATGLDEISCNILKLARPVIVESLTYLLNLSLSTGVFPTLWKEAKVAPLHKCGDLSNTSNYRPISILPIASKIIERAVHKHIYSYVSRNNILNVHQSGFRPSHSTETALVDMVDDWLSNINAGNLTGAVFIDLRKAFDTVNHDKLIKKICNIGASNALLKWLLSYLSQRTQKVSFNGCISNALHVNTGVPQGSILGPLLFLIFVNDVPSTITHSKISMYADDTTMYVSGNDVNIISKQLTEDLSAIKVWLDENKLFLNTDKTHVMLIGTGAKLRSVNSDQFSVAIDNNILKTVESTKCLGVTIDNELYWHKHVNSVIQKVFCKIALLRRLKLFIDSSTLNVLYRSLIQPLFDYCSVVWFGRFNDDMRKLSVLQKRCARVILSVNSLTSSNIMFPMLGWEPLQTRTNYFKALLMYKCLNGMAPLYLTQRVNYVSSRHSVNTRQAKTGLLALPPCANGSDTEYFKSSFSYSGVQLWNTLDFDIRFSANVHCFKNKYKS
jgi:hypothetical protein